MKKLLQVLGVLLLLALPALADNVEAWSRISRLQSFIEYFHLETGFYPADLAELENVFNQRAPKGVKRISLPLDPATNQPFKYAPDQGGKKYTLSVPDPSKYSERIAVSTVDWGFISDLADARRFQEVIKLCSEIMARLATAVELYAKDHQNQYPETLDPLQGKYITRHPTDPISNKNFNYKKLAGGYIISCPNPEKYGFAKFQYDSTRGLQIEQMKPGGAAAPPPAAPAPPAAPPPPAP